MNGIEINLSVIIAALAGMGLGMLWYSPLLFAKSWMRLVGKSPTDLKKVSLNKVYLLVFGANLLMAYVLFYFISLTGAKTIVDGAKISLIAGIGFVLPVSLIEYLFEGKPTRLFWVNNGYQLIVLIVMGILLVNLS